MRQPVKHRIKFRSVTAGKKTNLNQPQLVKGDLNLNQPQW
jgi:hypothetical protein